MEKVPEEEQQEAIVTKASEASAFDIDTIGKMMQGVFSPLAKSQEVVAKESTRQTEIIAKETTKVYLIFGFLGALIISIAGAAMFLDKDQITEKIIIAVLSFLGGLGIGKVGRRG